MKLIYHGRAQTPDKIDEIRINQPPVVILYNNYNVVMPIAIIGPIYTRDGSSIWDELGQRTVVRLIISHLCINTGFQTDHPR